MKRLFSTFMIVAVAGALVGCSKPLSGNYADKNKSAEDRITALEETIKRQKEEMDQLKTKKAARNKDETIAEALRKKRMKVWKKVCSNIRVSDGVARIYFCNMVNAGIFLSEPETAARFDLNLLLEETGRETGTIEYYAPTGEKIFSVSGSLTSVEFKTY